MAALTLAAWVLLSGAVLFATPAAADAPPTLGGLTPVAGPFVGGQVVTITGTGFVPGQTTVTFGGVASPSVVVTNPTSLTATTPARTPSGDASHIYVDLVITTPEGTAFGIGEYAYGSGTSAQPLIFTVPGTITIGGVATLTGSGFTPGSVVKLFVPNTAGKPPDVLPAPGFLVPTSQSPTSLTVSIPPNLYQGEGYVAVSVVNTDQGFPLSNDAGALWLATGGPPTLTTVNGVGIAPASRLRGIHRAFAEAVVLLGSPVTVGGTGFVAGPPQSALTLFSAGGGTAVFPPSSAITGTSLTADVPGASATLSQGPGGVLVSNPPYATDLDRSNGLTVALGARIQITGVSVTGTTVTVTGAGFAGGASGTVINLFNAQPGGAVNLGGLDPNTGNPKIPLTVNAAGTSFTFTVPPGAMAGPAFVQALNAPFIPFTSALDTAGAFTVPGGAEPPPDGLPPDPITIAPPVGQTVATALANATAFLYMGPTPIQTGVAPGTITLTRAAVLRGRVLERSGAALAGVKITILNHAEFGQTLSRADGRFDLAVNGGGLVTVRYQKAGFPSAQLQAQVPWQDYVVLEDLVLVPFDPKNTIIDFHNICEPAPSFVCHPKPMQVAQGSPVTDADGTRKATVLFPEGTHATMVLPDGSSQEILNLHVRATEYTVGPTGPRAMPAPLPPSSGYTYAVELSVDEAVAAGATDVRFNLTLPLYVENFLGFPVGTAVPAGYYDRQKGQWIASANGRVIKVLSVTGGLANLDLDGNGAADNAAALTALGVTAEERAHLAALYTAGQTLWRVPITHFTPWDCNWPYGPPADAIPPPGKTPDTPLVDKPNIECGSVIGCEDQTLGESLPVTGTPWRLHYQSDRTPGRKDASTLTIPVSGATLPASLRAIRVQVSIAGHLYQTAFTPVPNLTYTVIWDGKDAYGRPVQGAQPAVVQVHYDYVPQYYAVRSNTANSFARAEAAGFAVSGSRAASTVTLSKTWTERVSAWDVPALSLGGWSLSPHHVYDPTGKVLYLGDGTRRDSQAMDGSSIITTVAGTGVVGFSGDGGPAGQAKLGFPPGVAVGSDGSLYIADGSRIRRVGPDGIISTVAGTGTGGFSGDGGPAVTAQLGSPQGIAMGVDGSLYIADPAAHRIRRVGANGIITTVAGKGTAGFGGDGGTAVTAELKEPLGVAIGPDGSLYIADSSNFRIRRVGPDGIITTVAGNGIFGFSGDGGPAVTAQLSHPLRVAFGPDDSLYIGDHDNGRVRRVGPDGIITTVAGKGFITVVGGIVHFDFSGDGGPATQAGFDPGGLAVSPDGSLYIADKGSFRIRRVGPDGIISTVAGTGTAGFSGDGGPATQGGLIASDVAVGPNGNMYIADQFSSRIRRVAPSFPGFSDGDILIASEDAADLYVFNGGGRHLRTLDALTGSLRYQFGYDSAGRLISITDDDANFTTVERDAGGQPTAIVAPFGQRTTLTVNPDGYLSNVTNPAGETVQLTSTPDGLLTGLTDPKHNAHQFTYDDLGRLIRDDDPAGGFKTLARTETQTGYQVAVSTALGHTSTYLVERLSTGGMRRTDTDPSGAVTETVINTDGSRRITYPDGTVDNLIEGPDPRWGMQAPIVTSSTRTTPGGKVRTTTGTRVAVLTNPLNPFSLQTLTDTFTVNGRTSKRVYNAIPRTLVSTSAANRVVTDTLDGRGRVISSQIAGLELSTYTYDARGRLSSSSQGTGATLRSSAFSYGEDGFLASVTDPSGRTVSFTYDTVGRVTSRTLPGARTEAYSYDANSNVSSLTPPGGTAHAFSYTALDLGASYSPPSLPSGDTPTNYTYNDDRQPAQVIRPDATTVDFAYDAAGRPASVALPRGAIGYSYDSAGRLDSMSAPGGIGLAYAYDGDLLTGTALSGPVAGSVSGIYDTSFRLTSVSVNGANPVSFAYDSDDLLTSAGALTLSRNAQNGLLTGTTLGVVTDVRTYNGFAEPATYAASASGSARLSAQYTRDALGRITSKTETLIGVTDTYVYAYDQAGRLMGAQKNGGAVEAYTYDLNGNRLSATLGGASKTAIYDAQDRLTQYGATTYTYTAAGELATKTTGAQITTYSYDQLGNLLNTLLPGGPAITYLVDGQNRRVGKQVNGVPVQGFLYQNNLRPIAELDGAGTVVSRFVYAMNVNVPAYMVKGGVTYRILTDQLGSPRLVVNTTTGAIVQRMDYDSFGRVIADTNPGFQPFGFAGGLYDRDTKLVRFGARDYDAETGRWTAKDSIGFSGGDTNLYAYVGADPINLIDPRGEVALFLVREVVGEGVQQVVEELVKFTFGKHVLDPLKAEYEQKVKKSNALYAKSKNESKAPQVVLSAGEPGCHADGFGSTAACDQTGPYDPKLRKGFGGPVCVADGFGSMAACDQTGPYDPKLPNGFRDPCADR